MELLRRLAVLTALFASAVPAAASEIQCDGAGLPEPVLFVLQFPVPNDFGTIGSVFANHRGGIGPAGRGGDLMICYPSGVLRNLTREAGYGMVGMQGAQAISVRDPHVHWSGQKAVFSMVVGAATQQYQVRTDYFQLYEITGLGQGQTVTITKVAAQPTDYNNVEPAYLPDDSLVFSSDRPRNGQRHLYPQHDEYESAPTPTGLWKLEPASGRLTLLQHSPSGSFQPFVDSYGRIVFSRWDHLMRDQQGDSPTSNPHGAFNYAGEAADAARLDDRSEVFPEPRLPTGIFHGNRINHFMPWMIRADGTGEESLNHVGRHELFAYFEASINTDPLIDHFGAPGGRNNVLNLLQLIEDPVRPGRYYSIDAPEFGAHAAGQLVAFEAQPGLPARDIRIEHLSPRSGAGYPSPVPADFARYRNPTAFSDGSLVAAHTATASYAGNLGTVQAPVPTYQFRLRRLVSGAGGSVSPGTALTQGISRSISFWSPDVMVSYTGPLWELWPQAVRARTRPALVGEPPLETPEQTAFAQAGTDLASLKAFMKAWNLGLVVVRNATTRDAPDRQQPFNLRVPGGVQTLAGPGQVYDIAHFQVVQGDQVRGYGGTASPRAGRRVLPRWLNDLAALRFNRPHPGGPVGSTAIAADGSVAMFVPASRALSWQVTDPQGEPVVRERYWINLQPGEIRACDGCHGATPSNQAGQGLATNTPLALRELLTWFGTTHDAMFAGGFQP